MPFPALALFDLDGTLLDSAPDMLATVDAMRARRGIGAMDMATLRPQVSRGARAMIGAAFPDWDASAREAAVPELLEDYGRVLGQHGGPFDGVEAMLAALESAGTRWGIVTNKPEALAVRLMPLLGWQDRCAVLVGGDTLPTRKPDPAPLLHAADALGVAPADCAYVGDDARDIEAACAAGMPSIVALWGYRPADSTPAAWGGNVLVDDAGMLADPDRWPTR